MHTRRRSSILMLLFALASLPGCATETSADPSVLRGSIDQAMVQQVVTALTEGHRDFTIDSSDGGQVTAAVFMSTLLSLKGASLTATGRCWSACALLLFGVEHKRATAAADIRIHAAFYADGRSDDAPARNAVEFMIKNGVPHALAEQRGMGINLYRLTPAEIAASGISAGRTDM